MLAWSLLRSAGLAAVGVALMAGCVVQDQSGGSLGGSGGSSGGSSGGGSGSSSGGSTTPMLVDVDPNVTMNATTGDGVGVYVEYKTGGHWKIWWTCDTNKTSLDCAFDNVVSVTMGTITNAAGDLVSAGSAVTQTSTQQLEVTSDTTTGVDGVTFDTPFTAGQTPIITLDAKLNGSENGQYLFFVQDNQVNGGYQGVLTDPLMLEPKTP